jgi:hypothetical protein
MGKQLAEAVLANRKPHRVCGPGSSMLSTVARKKVAHSMGLSGREAELTRGVFASRSD